MSTRISVLTPTIRGDEALTRVRRSLAGQTYKDFEWLIRKHDPKDPPNFNKAMNEMLMEATGELVVFIQDYTKIPKDGLEQFWDAYRKNPKVFWTAPVGKTLDDVQIDWDWRIDRGGKCNFMEWEIDYAAAPYKLLKEIGGFDEELDNQWGYDNVNAGFRADLAGYEIRCLEDNRAVAYDHRKTIPHEYKHLMNPNFHNQRLKEIKMGLKLNYI